MVIGRKVAMGKSAKRISSRKKKLITYTEPIRNFREMNLMNLEYLKKPSC